MQNTNEDTEWNDVLRKFNIIPPKEDKPSNDVEIIEETTSEKLSNFDIDQLNEHEDMIDESDERIFEEYRQKRLKEIMEAQKASKFGEVLEISKAQYVNEINEAGDGIVVVVFIYCNRVNACKYLEEYLKRLAFLHPKVKFVKGAAEVMIENYPDKNTPTVFIYESGQLKKSFVGTNSFGDSLKTAKAFEEFLLRNNVIKETKLEDEYNESRNRNNSDSDTE